MKSAKEIRRDFINFFTDRGHKEVKSAPVIPQKDPTLLFTNAGMNQFKGIFLGKEEPEANKVVDSQKCIRVSGKHNDLEEVGKDTYHHTFFEMLGNWSFGEYYKEKAIKYAWELLTEVWELPKERLYATIYKEDDEAANYWRKVTDIDSDKILKFGDKENFWEMGETGPCGPCSEVHMYTGDDLDEQDAEKVNADHPQYIEIWNLVFIQYNRDKNGALHSLNKKHIDTGAGLERLVAILQNKKSNYDTDLFTPILDQISELTGVKYSEEDGTPHRVIADHMRMLSASIADGALPSNEGRGYVLRRVLRRASRYARMLDVHKPMLYKLVDSVITVLGEPYPEIKERKKHIQKVVKSEEKSFGETLDRGLKVFQDYKNEILEKNKDTIPGKMVFKLYDTYGFPVDLTNLLAEENDLKIDEEGFEKEMEKQRKRAREEESFNKDYNEELDWQVLTEGKDSEFVGYENEKIKSKIRKYAVTEDNKVNLILSRTPFYAESGGEVGDQGHITGNNFKIRIDDTQEKNQSAIHIGEVIEGNIESPEVIAEVNRKESKQIRANHTATHLLHAALREVLGDHVTQAGSLVEPKRLRFDLTHYEKVTKEEIRQVEDIVNSKIWENIKIDKSKQDYEEARENGAMALFGEQYDEEVRVVEMEDFSAELCGGKHADRTGDLGVFKIINETSVASGVRRIEAVTGKQALNIFRQDENILTKVENEYKIEKNELLNKIDEKEQQISNLKKKNRELEKDLWQNKAKELVEQADKIEDLTLVMEQIPGKDTDDLKKIGDTIRQKLDIGLCVVTSVEEGKPRLVVVVSDGAREQYNLKAGDLALELGKILGGGGGGRPHMATAGGSNPNNIPKMMEKLPEIVKDKL